MEISESSEGGQIDRGSTVEDIPPALIDHQYLGSSPPLPLRLAELPYKCFHCQFAARTFGRLRYHNAQCHRQNKPSTIYHCSHCKFETNNTDSLKNHFLSIHSEAVFQRCKYCTFTCVNKKDLDLHTKGQHKLQLLLTQEGKQSVSTDFPSSELLKQCRRKVIERSSCDGQTVDTVVYSEDSTGILQCASCSFQTKNVEDLNIHTKKIHTGPKYKILERYSCPFCTYSSSDCNELKKHIAVNLKDGVHRWMNTFCPFCEVSTSEREACLNHIRTQHPYQKPLKCDDCNFSSYWRGDLRVHKTNKHNKYVHKVERVFSCTECDYQTTIHEEFLKRHMLTHQRVEESDTQENDFVDANDDPLDDPIEISNEEPAFDKILFTCEKQCGYSTEDFELYRTHIERHQMKVQCHFCYLYVPPKHLHIHTLSKHQQIRVIDMDYCPYCDFKSPRSFACFDHLRAQHPDQRPIVCKKCKYSSYWPNELKRHEQMRHIQNKIESPFCCTECDYSTNIHPEFLKRHMLSKHNKEITVPKLPQFLYKR